MKKRKVIYIIIFIMIGIRSYFQISKEITEYRKKLETERSIQNVFDEMVVNDCEGLRNAEYINVLSYSTRYEIVNMEFASIAENISSFMTKRLWDYEGLGTGDSLFISFYFSNPAKDYEGTIVFTYNHQMHKLYIYQQDGEIPLEDLERYRDYLLGEVLLGNWLDSGESRFSWDDLGELEIVDYLLPYEYCGAEGNNADGEKQSIRRNTRTDSGQKRVISHGWKVMNCSVCSKRLNIMTEEIGMSGEERGLVQICTRKCWKKVMDKT